MNFSAFLKTISPIAKRVLPKELPTHAYIPLDLSSGNKDLIDAVIYESPQQFDNYITAYLEKNRGLVAYGGYAEVRDLYKSNSLFDGTQSGAIRNVHLGIDFWSPVGTSISTPLDGVVHSFNNNNSKGDYGPTIILEHTIEETTFYTLYGHLSLGSIAGLEVGRTFLAGTTIGTLGDFMINGGYAPHLHFQLIKDLQGYKGDYPGVSAKKNLGSFLKNCPDPLLLLGI